MLMPVGDPTKTTVGRLVSYGYTFDAARVLQFDGVDEQLAARTLTMCLKHFRGAADLAEGWALYLLGSFEYAPEHERILETANSLTKEEGTP